VRRVSRRSWRPARRSPRRSIPLVWASASDTISTAAGTAKPNAAATPKREKAVRREISSDLIFSVIFKPHLSSLLVFRTDLRQAFMPNVFAGRIDMDQRAIVFNFEHVDSLACSILN
jgi:hypothetical protein